MHCSEKQQQIMSDLYKSILQDIFILNPEKLNNDFPSPNALKNTFIIKEARESIRYEKQQYSQQNADVLEIMNRLDEEAENANNHKSSSHMSLEESDISKNYFNFSG